jgi:predicted ribosomally synthesized peptide with SipW-like signal peptide
MKAVNKKSLLVIAIALVLSLSVGLTMAYFSDYNGAKGGKGIALGGKTELHDDYDKSQKTVVIENTGETDVIVRVAVYAPIVNETQTVTVSGDNWAKVGEGDTAYWYYTEVIPVGKSSSPLIVNTEYMLNADLGDIAEVIVTHESIQAVKDANGKYVLPTGWADKVNK